MLQHTTFKNTRKNMSNKEYYDDSLLYFPKGCEFPDIQHTANLMWNFEAKLFRKQYGYFCVFCDLLSLHNINILFILIFLTHFNSFKNKFFPLPPKI